MKKYLLFAAACVALVACNNKNAINGEQPEGTPFEEGQVVTIGVSNGNVGNQAPIRKISGTNNTSTNEIDFLWETGDQILVTVGDKTATFTLSKGAGTAEAEFTGTMPASGTEFDIQYPVADPDLSQQTYVEGKIPAGKIAFGATDCTTDETATLSLANSILQLNLYGTSQTISKIVVTNVASEATYTLNISPAVTLGTTSETATPFFVVVPNGEYKISVGIYDNAETPAQICSFSTSKELSFGNAGIGTCANMPALEVATAGDVGGGLGDITKQGGSW